jgi:hypothetical protein
MGPATLRLPLPLMTPPKAPLALVSDNDIASPRGRVAAAIQRNDGRAVLMLVTPVCC